MTSGVAGMVGTVLERRYRIGSLLARGGMSTVYSGVDLRLDRPVAIKVMDQRLAGDATFVRRFELEARSAARLHHPHVVAVHDQGVDKGLVYLVLELVEGGTLRDLLDDHGALSPALALSVADPVASALSAAHRAGLVHRDVKPENVLIGPGGTVKVADFGLVRAVTGHGQSTGNVILGTVAYLSPEQVATGDADPRSDVYALGVLLYEMLTGAVPYTGDTALSVAYRHVHEDMPGPARRRPDLPPPLDALVVAATRRDPAARHTDAGRFLHALQRVRADLRLAPVPVPARGPAEQDTVPVANRPQGRSGTRAMTNVGAPPVDPPPAAGPPPAQDPTPPAGGRTAVYQADRRRSRRWLVVVTVLILVLAALIGTGAWWYGSGRWTAVPKVAGLDVTRAQQVLADADLTTHVRRQRDNTTPANTVIGTDPTAGTDEVRGTDVAVLVSTGRPAVPRLSAGTSLAAAQQAVRDAGLSPRHDPVRDRYSATVRAGTLLSVSPVAGTALPAGAPVQLVLSRGPAPITVPRVTGLSRTAAFAALRRAGLTPHDLPGTFDDSVPGGSVVRTDPAAGATVPGSGSHTVGVVVSTAVTVPDVTGGSVGAARAALRAKGLTVTVRQFLPRDDSHVFAQSVDPGSNVAAGTEVVLTAFP